MPDTVAVSLTFCRITLIYHCGKVEQVIKAASTSLFAGTVVVPKSPVVMYLLGSTPLLTVHT